MNKARLPARFDLACRLYQEHCYRILYHSWYPAEEEVGEQVVEQGN